jgi:hypothetical protein
MTNQSRDWVVEKLEFRVTYDTDITKVKKIIKRIGQEIAADPELGPHILQPLKSQGILAIEDSAMLIRAKFIAKHCQEHRPGSAAKPSLGEQRKRDCERHDDDRDRQRPRQRAGLLRERQP